MLQLKFLSFKMKKYAISFITILIAFVMTKPIYAETVAFAEVERMYFVERSTIEGELSKGRGNKIQVGIKAGPSRWLYFICEEIWNLGKVERATKSMAGYINSRQYIEPIEMLSKAGLSGCRFSHTPLK